MNTHHKKRRLLIGGVHGAAKRAHIDDATRHALQLRVTGKASCSDMTVAELERVLEEINRGRPRADTPAAHQRKIKALWISAWQLGVVRDRKDEALDRFIKRQTGIDALRFLPPAKAAPVVQALKTMMAEQGDVDWTSPKDTDERACVALALWRKLHGAGVVGEGDWFALTAYAQRILKIYNRRSLTAKEWGQVLPVLGRKLRATARRRDGAG